MEEDQAVHAEKEQDKAPLRFAEGERRNSANRVRMRRSKPERCIKRARARA